MRWIPNGWPGAVGIVVLVVGLLIVHGVPARAPGSGAVGGYIGYEFMYADERGPDIDVPTVGAREVAAAADGAVAGAGEETFNGRYVATVVAVFDAEDAARRAATAVEAPEPAVVLRHGPIVIVTPLEHDPDGPPEPLIAELAALGGRVLVEGDRYGEGTIVVDLVCTAAAAEDAAAIATELGDYGALVYYAYSRPPWVQPPLTDEEALARSTMRRWNATLRDAFAQDPALVEIGRRYLTASPAEREALTEELGRRTLERGAERLDGDVHPGVVALLAAPPSGGNLDDTFAWGLELGELVGPLARRDPHVGPTSLDQRATAQVGNVQAVGADVQLGWLTFNRFAIGLPSLLGYLDERNCGDVRVRLSDMEAIEAGL